MTSLLSYLPSLGFKGADSSRRDDDATDRWNHRVTVTLLIALSALISTQQYFGDPLHCWTKDFSGSQEKYIDHICWVSNTYKLPPRAEALPTAVPEGDHISYYQWVPLFLIFQAFLFYLPCVFWRVIYPKGGMDLQSILATAGELCTFEKNKDRKGCVDYIVQQIDRYLEHYPKESKGCCKGRMLCLSPTGKKQGNFLSIYYFVIKLIYLLNSFLQLLFINWFLSAEFHAYGLEVIKNWLKSGDFPTSPIFPYSTLCSFEIRAMGNVHRHTIQCVLSINFYNEKIYFVIWCWLILTIVVNLWSIVQQAYRMLSHSKLGFIQHFLRITKSTDALNARDVVAEKGFTRYLRQDGVFVLRMMKANVSGLVVAQVVKELYNLYDVKKPTMTSRGDRPEENGVGTRLLQYNSSHV